VVEKKSQRGGGRSAPEDRCTCLAPRERRQVRSYPAEVSRDAVEDVLVGVDPLRLSGGHHPLPQLSKPAHEEEILQGLTEHIAARDTLFFGDPIELAPDGLWKANRHSFSHGVLDSNTRSMRVQIEERFSM
jgi:hypothetical protein